jgi:hypothetical protein
MSLARAEGNTPTPPSLGCSALIVVMKKKKRENIKKCHPNPHKIITSAFFLFFQPAHGSSL